MRPLLFALTLCGLASLLLVPPAVAQNSRAGTMERTYDALSMEVRETLQVHLARQGFYSGTIDGVFGPNTLAGLLALCDCAAPSRCDGLTTAEAVGAYFNDLLTKRLSCETPLAVQPRQIARLYMPEHCGGYESGLLGPNSWFSGGEGGAIDLKNPQEIAGLPALLFEGIVVSEGYREPAGHILVIDSTFRDPKTSMERPVIVIVRPEGVSLYEPCP